MDDNKPRELPMPFRALHVEPGVFTAKHFKCDACGNPHRPGQYAFEFTSDLDPGRSALLCLECHIAELPYTRRKICEMIDRTFPEFARQCADAIRDEEEAKL